MPAIIVAASVLAFLALIAVWANRQALNTENWTETSSELLENQMLLKTTALSILTIFLATSFGPLQRVLDTVELNVEQWAICIVVAASIILVAEVKKLLKIRTSETPVPVAASAGAA